MGVMMMKSLLFCTVLSLGASSAFAAGPGDAARQPAPAGTKVTGANAKGLIRALKYAGIKATGSKTKWTFTAAAIKCHSASETEDGLGSYDCEVDKVKLKDAAAYQLHEAMQAAGLQ